MHPFIKHIETYKSIDSTKDLAEKYIISKKYDDHFLIIAESQTQGKGRKGNDWYSPKGGLWFSLVLNYISQQKCFTLFIGYCVLKTLKDILSTPHKKYVNNKSFLEYPDRDYRFVEGGEGGEYWSFKIKWPNDIYLNDNKICGIICSQHIQHNMTNIGIGINTNIPISVKEISDFPENPEKYYTSIKSILNIEIDNHTYLSTILVNIFSFLPLFEKQGISLFYDDFQKFDFLKDRYIKIYSGNDFYEGLYQGIDLDGNLLLKNKEGQIINILSGTVVF